MSLQSIHAVTWPGCVSTNQAHIYCRAAATRAPPLPASLLPSLATACVSHCTAAGSAALSCKPCLHAFQPPAAAAAPGSHPHRGAPSAQQQQQLAEAAQLQRSLQHSLLGGRAFTQPLLLLQALTHVSRFGGLNYQRLEFLGDAVLDLYASSWLMLKLGQTLRDAGHDR